MGRAFVYVILGGGVASGYAAFEFARRGISAGELCIISEEAVAPYERPALSKGFLLPEAPARLPAFHTCVGSNEERLTPKWYSEHGGTSPGLQAWGLNLSVQPWTVRPRPYSPFVHRTDGLGLNRPVQPSPGAVRPLPPWCPNINIISGALMTAMKIIPKGIELVLGTRVKSADVKRKTLTTVTGETISYKFLIIATGARALKLEEFGVSESDSENICYLRNLADANKLVSIIQASSGGNAVVIGGGYIGMECAAALVTNRIKVTMVFPEAHCMARLFTPKIADFYEAYYESKGVSFIKGTVLSSFENDSDGKVTAVLLRDGTRVPTNMVVVGIGIRPNTGLFEGQLAIEKGGIKVNGRMQTSNGSVYAVGDVATFPVRLFGSDFRRLEHVDSARKTARHAISAILDPEKTGDFDYLPFFYSRVFTLSWQFYGDSIGEVIHYGDLLARRFGAYWVDKGRIVGAFLEGGNREEYEAIAEAVKFKMAVKDNAEVEKLGVEFVSNAARHQEPDSRGTAVEKPLYTWHAAAGVAVAICVATFAYWHGTRRRRW